MWSAPFIALATMTGGMGLYWLRNQKSRSSESSLDLHQDYFKGLNYLINEQPDKAVDVFIRLLEVDSDTVEMHLALGNLFRQRGEVDRAIRIHQNLIARPKLNKDHHMGALAALGEDYFRAGVLDRAELLFLDLLRLNDKHEVALKFLLVIYQREKEWLKAIDIAKKMVSVGYSDMKNVIAQFYCELAVQAVSDKKDEFRQEVKQFLKRAEHADPDCVRANIIRGDLALSAKDYKAAIKYYMRVEKQDSAYMTEVIAPIVCCYENLQSDDELKIFLMHCLDKFPSYQVIHAISHFLQRTENSQVAIAFLTEQIKHTPSLRGLAHLITLYVENSFGDTREKLKILQSLINNHVEGRPLYQCGQCGFAGKILSWSCPGCHKWVTIKPISGLQ